MVLLMMVLVSCDTDGNVNGIKLTKHYVAPHFDCLDIRNAMVPLTILSTSQGFRDAANGVTLAKRHVTSPFCHHIFFIIVAK